MSLDFYLMKTIPTSVYSGNITHNVSPMWLEAGVYDALYNSEGMLASRIIPTLEVGLDDMKKNPEKYEKMNPENGWGSYKGAVEYLEEILNACKENPDAIIEISR